MLKLHFIGFWINPYILEKGIYDYINLIKVSPFRNKPFIPIFGYASFSESKTGNEATNNPRRSATSESK